MLLHSFEQWSPMAVFLGPLLAASKASASVVTVYRVSVAQSTMTITARPPYPSVEMQAGVEVSALSPFVENGMTRFEEKAILSRVIVHNSDRTSTVFSTPVVRTYTVLQDASHLLVQSAGPGFTTRFPTGDHSSTSFDEPGFSTNCTFNQEEKTGVCVGEIYVGDGHVALVGTDAAGKPSYSTPTGPTQTYTYTASGVLVPYATVTISAGYPRVGIKLGTGLALLAACLISGMTSVDLFL